MSPVTHLVASTGVDSKYELLLMHCFVIPPFFHAGLSYYEEVNTTIFALRAIKDWFINKVKDCLVQNGLSFYCTVMI